MIEFGIRTRMLPGEFRHLPMYIVVWAGMTVILMVVWPEAITLFYLFFSFFGTVLAGLLNIALLSWIDRRMRDRL